MTWARASGDFKPGVSAQLEPHSSLRPPPGGRGRVSARVRFHVALGEREKKKTGGAAKARGVTAAR